MVEDLDVFSRRDHTKVMSWNQSIPRSVDNCFHWHFEDVVRRAPDAPAICSWDRNFTYLELDTLSTSLANNLTHLGVVPETFVLVCFNKTSIAYASMLGIFKAGGAFVAIDPLYPASRIQAIITATNASIVVAEPAHCHLFAGIMEHILAIDPKLAEYFPLMPSVARAQSCPSNPAYAVFTSGSTGAPKGVIIEHRNLCTAALALASPMRINSSSRVLQFAAYTFDLSYGDIFVTLSQGGCICVPSEHERVNDLVGAIVRMNVNTACMIPSVARMFQPEDVPCLETLLLGGEALVQENLEHWAAKVALVTLYGPSECTIWCTAQTNVKIDSPANNIGRGVGALLWITNATNHDRLCPIGCIGELLIEGPVVARGYLDAEQTKRSFIENPSWAEAEPGQRRRFYKTGDLVRYKSDGTVSFLGRKDTQIKLHGRRIEMGEIEYHLSSHDLLRQSMVTLPAAGIYHGKLVAIVVPKTSKAPYSTAGKLKLVTGVAKQRSTAEATKIKDCLSSKIPSYMLPQHWIAVEEIPLMISGKMNRVLAKKFVESIIGESPKELDDKQSTQQDLDDPLEICLRNIWAHVLHKYVTDIGVEQDFVSLGGDSFAAMELVARCKAEGYTLTVRDVLDNSTIRQMASMLKMPLLATAAIGHAAPKKVSRVRDYSSVHMPLKLPPVWWDAQPAIFDSVA
jgi:amino acid adenylation domain-containing protein